MVAKILTNILQIKKIKNMHVLEKKWEWFLKLHMQTPPWYLQVSYTHANMHTHEHTYTSSQVLWYACMHVCRHTPVYAFSDLDNYKNKTKILKIWFFKLAANFSLGKWQHNETVMVENSAE